MFTKRLKLGTGILLLCTLCTSTASAARQEDGTVRSVDIGNKTVVLEELRYNAESPLIIHNMNDESTALSDLSKISVGMPIRVSIEKKDGQELISEIWILRGNHSEVD